MMEISVSTDINYHKEKKLELNEDWIWIKRICYQIE